jgi:glycosyltransferase involved in cell wall biosynthesis
MIKVLLNTYSEFPSPNQGGPNKVIYEILKSIDRKIFETYYLSKHLFSFIEEKGLLEEYVNEQLSLKKTTAVKLIKKSSLFKHIVSNSFYMRYHFEKGNRFYKNINSGSLNYDVLHSHDVKSFALLHSKIKCKKVLTIHTKGPMIDDLSDYLGNSKILSDVFKRFDMMENEAICEADVVTFPSYAALELFKSKKSIRVEKTKVIYNGIDPYLIQKINTLVSFEKIFQINAKPYIKIINIADHIEPKNIELILSALYELIKNLKIKALFINVGTGPLTNKYLSMVKELDISGNVKFLGKIRNEDVITLMKDADYLLQPSQRVIFDYVILEALACGTTVIASNEGGNKEIIKNGYNGTLVKDICVENITSEILFNQKLQKGDLLESLKKFDQKKMVAEYQKVYLK